MERKIDGLVLCALVTLAMSAGAARAEYRVAAFKNAPGYQQIIKEDYTGATGATMVHDYAGDYGAYANRCVSQLLSDELNSALSSCNRALRAAPSNGWQPFVSRLAGQRSNRAALYSNRGVVLALQGRLLEARDDFEKALSLDADNTNALSNLKNLAASDVSMR
jgi:tetratricopeptide (TPR) repeat protein